MMFPSREEAERIFLQAYEKNPEPWGTHCRWVAFASEKIAAACGLDADKAYVLGLFHDVGYSEFNVGKGRACHILIGYELMSALGYKDIARICLTHSFCEKDIRFYSGSDMVFCSEAETGFIADFLARAEYDDYDRLIQLCDCLGSVQGIVMMEQRFVDVTMRNGFKAFTLKKWAANFKLKDYFDGKCGVNIYSLFKDEMIAEIFGS